MARQILVALKSEDRLSEMVPYVEKIALPGMRVVFLIRFIPQTASEPPLGDLAELECAVASGFFVGEPGKSQSMKEQRLAAEHKVFLALEALIKRGIEIRVDVYTGSLRRALKSYTSKGEVCLIVMRARREQIMMDFFHRVFPVFGSFKHRTLAPILVFHATHAV